MKRAGSPIMNSEEILHLMTASFREEKASPENMPCRIGSSAITVTSSYRSAISMLLSVDPPST